MRAFLFTLTCAVLISPAQAKLSEQERASLKNASTFYAVMAEGSELERAAIYQSRRLAVFAKTFSADDPIAFSREVLGIKNLAKSAEELREAWLEEVRFDFEYDDFPTKIDRISKGLESQSTSTIAIAFLPYTPRLGHQTQDAIEHFIVQGNRVVEMGRQFEQADYEDVHATAMLIAENYNGADFELGEELFSIAASHNGEFVRVAMGCYMLVHEARAILIDARPDGIASLNALSQRATDCEPRLNELLSEPYQQVAELLDRSDVAPDTAERVHRVLTFRYKDVVDEVALVPGFVDLVKDRLEKPDDPLWSYHFLARYQKISVGWYAKWSSIAGLLHATVSGELTK